MEMSLKMMMSLVDTATPVLTTFVGLLDSLGPKVTGLANRFNTLDRNIARTGATLEAAAPKLGKFDASVSSLESKTSSLERVLSTLPGSLNAMVGSLQSAVAVMNQAAQSMQNLSSASTAAAGNVGTASGQLQAMGGVVNSVTSQVRTLHGVMEGLAAQWVSMKIFEAGKASVDEASQYQQAQMKVANLNFPVGQQELVQQDAANLSKRLGISVREGLEAYLSAIAGLATTDYGASRAVIQNTLDEAVKTAILLRLRGDKSSVNDLTRNIYGLVEARGQAFDPDAAKRTMAIIQQFNSADAQKLSTKDMETVFRQMKGGLGVTASDEGVMRILAFAEQLKAAGHGGGGGGMGVSQAGTAATQVAKWGTGGVQNKETIRMLIAMGLVDPSAVRGDSSTTMDNLRPGAIKNSGLAKEDPIKYMMDMAPHALALAMQNPTLFAKGQDLNSAEGIKAALSEVALAIFKNINVANMAVQSWLPGSAERINSKVEQVKQSKGTDASMRDADETYLRNLEKFQAAVKTFETTIGTTLLPMLTRAVEGLTVFVGFLDRVAAANPTATTLTAIAFGITAVGLALFGLQKMFGIFTLLSTFLTTLTGIGGASTAAATGLGAVGGAVTTLGGFLLTALKWLGRGAGILGALLLLYDALVLVFDIKIWGASIGTWFASFVDSILTGFSNLKDKALEFFGIIDKREAEIRKRRNDESLQNGIAANFPQDDKKLIDSKRLSVGKIGGGAEAAPVKTPEQQNKETEALEKLKAEAAKIKAGTLAGKPDKGYNTEAGQDQQEVRIQESGMRSDLKMLDAERKAALVSDDQYYEQKKQILETRYDAMIASLQEKLKALRPDQVQQKDKADADIVIKQKEKEAALEALTSDKERAASDYKVQMDKVEALLDEAQGRRHESRLYRLKQELDLLQKKATLNNRTEDSAKITKAQGSVDSGIKFEESYLQYEQINNRVLQQMDLIDAKVKAGLMTESEAAREKYDLRALEAKQLEGIIAQMEILAASVGDEKLVQKIAMLKVQMTGYSTALAPEAAKLKGVLESSFTSFFSDITSRNKTLKESFRDLFSNINQGIMDLISKNLSQQLFKSMFGDSGGGGGGGGFGGILGSLASKLFGGGGASSGASPGLVGQGIEGLSESLMTFDVGTNRVPFDMLAKIHKDEIIVPAADRDAAISAMQGGGSGGGTNVTNHFYVQGTADQRTQNQIANRASMAILQAQRNR